MYHESQYRVKPTPHEINYRKEHCQDFLNINHEDVQCTACGEQLHAETGRCFINRIVGTLQCKVCYERCEEKQPWEPANRLRFCIMCGKSSKEMQKCFKKDCTYSSCEVCILRNKSDAAIETNKRKWNCFICNTTQLYPRRALAAAVMTSLSEKSCDRPIKTIAAKGNMKKKKEKWRSNDKCTSHSSDSELSSDFSEENVFQKKVATQKPSTSATQSNLKKKLKTSKVNLSSNHNNSHKNAEIKSSGENYTQLSARNSQWSKSQRSAINDHNKKSKEHRVHGKKQENTTQLDRNTDTNKNGHQLDRQNSNSSSDKEFSRFKIIQSYVALQKLPNIEKDYTHSPSESPSDKSSLLSHDISKENAFILKNNVSKFFQEMEKCIKKLENDIQVVKNSYHYKENLKIKDATRIMMGCTNIIRDLKENVNSTEEKVINCYDTWCKKVKTKNIFINKTRTANDVDTPTHFKENINKRNIEKVVITDSSDTDSDITLKNFSFNEISQKKRAPANAVEDRNSDVDSSTDSLEKEMYNKPSSSLINLNKNNEKITNHDDNNQRQSESLKNIDKNVDNNIETNLNRKSIEESAVRDSPTAVTADRSDDEGTNSSTKSIERSSTPISESNINCDYSPHSLIDMFQDDDETEINDKNSSLDTPTKSKRKLSTTTISSFKNHSNKKSNVDEEEEKAKRYLLRDSSSSDSDCGISQATCKKSRLIISSDDEEEQKKTSSNKVSTDASSPESCTEKSKKSPKSTESIIANENSDEGQSEKNLSHQKSPKTNRKSTDESDESLVNNNNDDDVNDINEERAKKALLASSSDSESEAIIDTSNEKNNSLNETPADDELSDKSSVEDKTKIRKHQQRQRSASSDTSDNSSTELPKMRRKKLSLRNNVHYKSDPKLRMIVAVELTRLGKNVLAQYSNALKLSKELLENKRIKSLMSIANIEKKKKRLHSSNSSASSEDEDASTKRLEKSKKKEKEAGETLMDHFNKVIENNKESGDDNDEENSTERNSLFRDDFSMEDDIDYINTAADNFLSAADQLYKDSLLHSSNSETETEKIGDNEKNKTVSDNNSVKSDNETKLEESQEKEKKKKRNKSNDSNSDNNSDKDASKSDKSSWKRSKLLTAKFSDTDSEIEELKFKKKIARQEETSKNGDGSSKDEDSERATDSSPTKKKRNRRRRFFTSDDSDIKITDVSDATDSDDTNGKKNKLEEDKKDERKKLRKRRRKTDNSSDSSTPEVKKSKLKRKRIRTMDDDSDSDSANDNNSSQGGNKSGRKNIRKVLKDKQVAEDTKQAGKLEEERLKRMSERQKLYNEMYEARLANEEKVDKLVLDFDEESKEVLLSVDVNLVKRLKPHQARGIKFMWDAAFESLERAKETSGSGCILAHCMGLGKSFQVVTLAHTLLSNHEKTNVNTILIVAPLSTVLNWVNEFKIWLSEVDDGDDIDIYEMTKCKTTYERKYQLENWMRTGGILIIGYEMFRNLTNATKKVKKSVRESILKCLIDPGADLVICDEGHLLKNEDSAISKAMRRIRTLRRVVLTGTPLQNNLIEYHCMVQFVKPNLLGTKKEFSNRFVNPIQNGQFDDSTEYDVKIMKKRAHVLHKMLEGSVQRFDYSVLTPFLPPKQEYVILVRLTEVQVKLYQYYLDNMARQQVRSGSTLFADFQALQRIWTHPSVVKSYTAKMIEKRREAELESEDSMRDFIDDDSDSASSSKPSSNSDSDVINLDSSDEKKKTSKRGTRANPVEEPVVEVETENKEEWWSEFVKPEELDDMRVSAKLLLLFDIIKESEAIGDKVLVFSQSLYSLTLIENFLSMIDDETQRGNELESLGNHKGSWALGLDYFRFDGQTSADNRSQWVKLFNKPTNTRARLFLISTRAGGLGINLTAANRVVIFDASWNPSHDVQSIFRIYRFGQKKPCYVYRLLAAGTMEEKIYNRQVTKLSLSCRVVDEQQIERHFSNNDLAELYKFDPPRNEPAQLSLPTDRLIAEIFLRHKKLVETYHEHDSLLENIAAEELDDEERKQAWLEYEQEKAGQRMPPMQMYQSQMMMQQSNQMMNSFNMPQGNIRDEFSNLLLLIRKDFPHITEAAQKDMAFRALSNMYNYVENQITTNLNTPNIPIIPNTSNPTATLANALAQQEYTRQHSMNKYQHQQKQIQQQQFQMQYAQMFGNKLGNVAPAAGPTGATSRGNNSAEVPSSSSGTNSVLPASSSTKRQEE